MDSQGVEMALNGASAAHAEPYGSGEEPDLLGRYLTEIGGTPLLTAQQEVELARRIEAGVYAEHLLDEDDDLPPGRAAELHAIVRDGALAKDHMIRANLRLVVAVARKYHQRDMALLDVIQEGNLGLIRAVEKFDYAKGYKFSTYAMWWIRQAIERGVAQKSRAVRLPMHVVEELARFNRAERDLGLRLGRDPSLAELARETRQPREKVAELKRLTLHSISLDTPVGANGDASLGDLIWDGEEAPAEGVVEFGMLAKQLRVLLGTLPPREAQIISWRFGLDSGYAYTLQQVGDRLGLTRERVRQLENKALNRLRDPKRLAKLVS